MKLLLICPHCGNTEWEETKLAGEPIFRCKNCQGYAQPEEMESACIPDETNEASKENKYKVKIIYPAIIEYTVTATNKLSAIDKAKKLDTCQDRRKKRITE